MQAGTRAFKTHAGAPRRMRLPQGRVYSDMVAHDEPDLGSVAS